LIVWFFLFFLQAKGNVFFPFAQHRRVFQKDTDFFSGYFRVDFLDLVADESDHRFADISKKVVLSLVFRDKVVEEVSFQYDKKSHLLPLIIGNLGPSGNTMLLINVIDILFYKLKILIVLFLAHDIESFLEFL
jgi:hypothetical protein